MRYPREFEIGEIMLKEYTDMESHLKIQMIVKMGYKWDKMVNDLKYVF